MQQSGMDSPSGRATPQVVGAALGKVLGRRAGRNRLLRATWAGSSSFLGTVGRVLHTLFLEVTGFMFLCLALIGFVAARREYHAYKAGTIGPGKVALATAFLLLFLYFGANSIWRARRRNKN